MHTIAKLFMIALLASSVLAGCSATSGGTYSGSGYSYYSHDKHD